MRLACLRPYILALLNTYSGVLLVRSPVLGAAMLVVTFLHPSVAAGGLAGLAAACLFARFLRLDPAASQAGSHIYNALLTGLMVGYLFQITPLSLFLAALAGLMAAILALSMNGVLTRYLNLPTLSLPFAMVSMLVWLGAGRFSNLIAVYDHGHFDPLPFAAALPSWLAGFLRALGAVVFQPSVTAGIILLLALLAVSRIMALLAAGGYAVGMLVMGALSGSFEQAFRNIYGFNFILIAMALGGVFLVPSLPSYAVALAGVAGAAVVMQAVEVFWAPFGIPASTFPFTLTTLLLLHSLGIAAFPALSRLIKRRPEETLDHHLSAQRHCGAEISLWLPFSGRWTVWQGCDGQWTHKGVWRHAYDFVLTGPDGRTHSLDGSRLEHYHAFHKPVLSPLRGVVVRVVRDLPDNPPGSVDHASHWGNVVILRDEWGTHVVVAHFACATIRVTEGEWVERGTVLGLCGNSGYSPQPHIHIQAQVSAAIGAATLPWRFVSWIRRNHFVVSGLPAPGDEVESCTLDKSLENRLTFLLGSRLSYQMQIKGSPAGRLDLTVDSAADGGLCLESGKGRLYFSNFQGVFHILGMDGDDRGLRALFLALSRLPLSSRTPLSWSDSVPLGAFSSGFAKEMLLLLGSFAPSLPAVRVQSAFAVDGRVVGKAAAPWLRAEQRLEVEFDAGIGPCRVAAGPVELTRIDL